MKNTMDITRKERERKTRINEIMAGSPDPNAQMFWVNHENGFDEFLVKRFDDHYTVFKSVVKNALNRGHC